MNQISKPLLFIKATFIIEYTFSNRRHIACTQPKRSLFNSLLLTVCRRKRFHVLQSLIVLQQSLKVSITIITITRFGFRGEKISIGIGPSTDHITTLTLQALSAFSSVFTIYIVRSFLLADSLNDLKTELFRNNVFTVITLLGRKRIIIGILNSGRCCVVVLVILYLCSSVVFVVSSVRFSS